jgi:hypothetical protein
MAERVTLNRSIAAAGGIDATVVHPDATLQAAVLLGDDAHRFERIRQILGGSVTAVQIDDQDGPAALGWMNTRAASTGLIANRIASALVGLPIWGPMVITGLGHGEHESTSSIHPGLRLVLEQMASAELERRDQ